jgi:hypothetical protein
VRAEKTIGENSRRKLQFEKAASRVRVSDHPCKAISCRCVLSVPQSLCGWLLARRATVENHRKPQENCYYFFFMKVPTMKAVPRVRVAPKQCVSRHRHSRSVETATWASESAPAAGLTTTTKIVPKRITEFACAFALKRKESCNVETNSYHRSFLILLGS